SSSRRSATRERLHRRHPGPPSPAAGAGAPSRYHAPAPARREPPVLTALVRPVSPSLADCELTYLAREPIDVARSVAQHRAYLEYLGALGARLVRLPAAPELPDAVFVEDTAVVLDELAVLTRPGVAV